MELIEKIVMLEGKNTTEGYECLKDLEGVSEDSDVLYQYIDRFVAMVSSDKYVVRVRGFRLFCKQARWDCENKIDENIDFSLKILRDDKPTAVRQALAALQEVVKYKPELQGIIRDAVNSINYGLYKESMHSLIAKDVQVILDMTGGQKDGK